mmetsp:Transcript_135180/g.432070  ORF Transcript_135180/g.432070 Transcript_135180/m.432070 type:complete len:106 (-) Transcript_135180:2195-2512(-)
MPPKTWQTFGCDYTATMKPHSWNRIAEICHTVPNELTPLTLEPSELMNRIHRTVFQDGVAWMGDPMLQSEQMPTLARTTRHDWPRSVDSPPPSRDKHDSPPPPDS